MATKIINFVRHGETKNNSLGIRQGSEGGLTEKGRVQALAAAKRFPRHKGRPQIIIASPYERTRETAAIIAKELHLKVKYCDLLKERKNPSEIRWIFLINVFSEKSYHDDDLRVSDEENFSDLKKRAKKLLNYITWRRQSRIIMVTHKIFLKMIIAYMLHGDSLSAIEYNNLSYFNPIDNAGMAICTYTSHWFKPAEWKVLVWNDLE